MVQDKAIWGGDSLEASYLAQGRSPETGGIGESGRCSPGHVVQLKHLEPLKMQLGTQDQYGRIQQDTGSTGELTGRLAVHEDLAGQRRT